MKAYLLARAKREYHPRQRLAALLVEAVLFMDDALVKTTILTVGSRGDVQPYVALGLCLRSAGYDVDVATHACWEPFV